MTMKLSYSAVGVDVLLVVEDIVPIIVYCLNTWKIKDYSLVLILLVSFVDKLLMACA